MAKKKRTKEYILITSIILFVFSAYGLISISGILPQAITTLPPIVEVDASQVNWEEDNIFGGRIYFTGCISETCASEKGSQVKLNIGDNQFTIGSMPTCESLLGKLGSESTTEETGTTAPLDEKLLTEYPYNGEFIIDPSFFRNLKSFTPEISTPCGGISGSVGKLFVQVECSKPEHCLKLSYILNELPLCSSMNKCEYRPLEEIIKEAEQARQEEREERLVLAQTLGTQYEGLTLKEIKSNAENTRILYFVLIGLMILSIVGIGYYFVKRRRS